MTLDGLISYFQNLEKKEQCNNQNKKTSKKGGNDKSKKPRYKSSKKSCHGDGRDNVNDDSEGDFYCSFHGPNNTHSMEDC